MARRPLPALFLRARDEASTGRRAAVAGVVLLAAVHGFLVAPAVEEERRAEGRRAEAAARAELRGELEAMAAEGARMGEESRSALGPIVARLAGDVGRDLERLAATVVAVRTATLEEGGTEPREAEPAAPIVADPGAGVAPLELDDPEALFALREAGDAAALLAVLAPIVDAAIVRPRFEAATRELRETAGTRLRVRCDGLATKLPRLRARLPEADADWEAFAAAVGSLRRLADEATIEPPRREGWWRRSPDPVALGLDDLAVEQLRSPLAADELAAGLKRVEEARARVAARLAPEAVPDGRLEGPRRLVPPFPLVLGLALGGLLAAAASRVRELGTAVRLLLDDGGPLGLRAWLFARLAPGQPLGTSAQTARRLAFRRSLAVAAAAAAWVLQAGAHVAPLATGSRALLMPAIGLVAVIAGAVVHRRALGDALGLFAPAEPREPAPVAVEPPLRPDGVVAGQDLAR